MGVRGRLVTRCGVMLPVRLLPVRIARYRRLPVLLRRMVVAVVLIWPLETRDLVAIAVGLMSIRYVMVTRGWILVPSRMLVGVCLMAIRGRGVVSRRRMLVAVHWYLVATRRWGSVRSRRMLVVVVRLCLMALRRVNVIRKRMAHGMPVCCWVPVRGKVLTLCGGLDGPVTHGWYRRARMCGVIDLSFRSRLVFWSFLRVIRMLCVLVGED